MDARAPSPVRTQEIVGRIGARDIGDARLTDHFYAFTGMPGDLLITIETRNLNGDIDIFTAGALRPMLKLALYAEVTTPVTKSVFLRQRENLVLRVEARSPNDEDGTYHINFGGSFSPVAASDDDEKAGSEIASTAPATRKGKRVTSVGARIEATAPPPLEVAEGPTPQPSPTDIFDPPPAKPRPVEAPAVEARSSEAASAESLPETKVDSLPATPKSRNARTRANTRRGRNRPVIAEEADKNPVTEEATKKTDSKEKPTEAAVRSDEEAKSNPVAEVSEKPVTLANPEKSKPSARKSSKKSKKITEPSAGAASESSRVVGDLATATAEPSTTSTAKSKDASGEESADPGPPADLSKTKLVIEMLDGSRIERFMTTIRRVNMESGQIVVIGTDGTVERVRLSRVLKMSIGP
jgi:hypothetical protein